MALDGIADDKSPFGSGSPSLGRKYFNIDIARKARTTTNATHVALPKIICCSNY